MENKICKTCGAHFATTASAKGTYCSKVCHHKDQGNISRNIAEQKRQKLIDEYKSMPKSCANCKIDLPYNKRRNSFCSRSCCMTFANMHRTYGETWREERRAFALASPSGWAKDRPLVGNTTGHRRAKYETRNCATCNAVFEIRASDPKKTCSKACSKIGGVREGSGRAKTGRYKGIYCGSTYELAFLIWHLDRSIPISRCTDSFPYNWKGKEHVYHPDFVVNGTIFEIKGRIVEVDYVKVASCDAVMICGDKIQQYIADVSKSHNVSKDKLWTLYEDTETKNCMHCDRLFTPKTSKVVYCGRSCAMLVNRLRTTRLQCT